MVAPAVEREHACDWIVISTITSDQEKGLVEVVATLGGRRDRNCEERRFLVPSNEYHQAVVASSLIKPVTAPVTAPSDFIGWWQGISP